MITEKNAKIVTALPGPKSKELAERKDKCVPPGIGIAFDIYAAEAKDALIKDVDGNVFIDVAAAIGVQNAGHCDEEVVAAIKEQAEKLIHPCFQVVPYEAYIDLAEKLIEITPGSYEKTVYFANSGAEAVENAVKVARRFTGKQGIISLEAAFHGRTYMAMGLTSKVKPYKYGMGPFPGELYKIPSPYCYRCPMGGTYPGCGLACVERLAYLLKSEYCEDNIAAVIAEPVQGEGGFIIPPKDYLKTLHTICKEHNILLIADEVQTGFCRTGKMFACEGFEVEPDIMTLSKSIAAGMPISAVVGRKEVMAGPQKGEIGGTYGGNPLACVASLRTIKKMQELKLDERAAKLGNMILTKVNAMKDKYSVIGDVRGIGAMAAVEFVKDRETKEPNKEIISKITKYAYHKGVLIISAGLLGNIIRFLPPLVMTEDQMNYVLEVFEEAVANA
ncbi:MAG: 4-aminobutyrate aminotransferase apoenzyme [Clostridia bacterium]|jgi:4-aminobutyrate aminotransferase/(S)-3-amino-2-methylpropionate transaminase|nr:4-aminobutyrate aminotransferase apoenzyme [Clostridia bacterium]